MQIRAGRDHRVDRVFLLDLEIDHCRSVLAARGFHGAGDITAAPAIVRDLALIKVTATGEARTHVMQLVDVYRARVVDVSPESLVIEATGTEDKIDSLL